MTIQDKLTNKFLELRFGKTFPTSSTYFKEWKDRLISNDTRSMDDVSLRIYSSLEWAYITCTIK